METLQQHLANYFGATAQDWSELATWFEQTSLNKGDFWLQPHQYAYQMAFVGTGYLRIYAHTPQGEKEVTQWISTPGAFLTDLESFVFNTPARWYIQALTPCTLYTLSQAQYQRISTIVPHWQTIERRFLARCFVHLEKRIFQQLSMSAEERYLQLWNQVPELFNTIPLNYLASMMGMTPETLSRLRRKRLS